MWSAPIEGDGETALKDLEEGVDKHHHDRAEQTLLQDSITILFNADDPDFIEVYRHMCHEPTDAGPQQRLC